ncbi:pescadillo homolog [[Candida] railenensis]|uniref:Pescadillo homolog n=1 Tax=[Candida] railenensis TaxID=45579 RepID=A0A9P0VYH4_9ASCO|nr:pescadillo homolog [[Candida] railenensis]
MAAIKKKGTSGNAKNFITRTQAVKKLQVSLADFRRLCIFKGIYPREPRNKKKANKGSTAPVTFYYAKDIQYLMHEPVLAKFREHKTFAKKLQRALGRGEVNDAQKLEANRPKYTLEHVIKERYPSFLDALRDIDDPLNMLFLFSNLPATDKVSHKVTKSAEKLCNQWLAYVAKERLIKKVFVSIKGVYYQANVKGQEVRWLVPFKFPTNIPSDVDFRIMLTFLEFYSTLLHFVLYRLYNDSNLIYPPTIDIEKLKGIGGLSSYVLESKTQGVGALLPKQEPSSEADATAQNGKAAHLSSEEVARAENADDEQEDADVQDEDEENVEEVALDTFASSSTKVTGDILSQPSKFASPTSTLFSKFIFYVGREVPLDILEFCILSCGGSIVSEIALDDLQINQPEAFKKLDLSNITHQIVDRPTLKSKVAGRTYIQPQWVFDCLNKSELLNVSKYAPGETLPPHLSPWGDAGGYDPEAAKPVSEEQAAEEEAEEEEIEEDQEDQEEDDEEEEEEEEDEDLKAQKELEMEAAGVKFSEVAAADEGKKSKKAKGKRSAEDEEKELKMIMMTNKHRKLYKKMQYGINKEEVRQEELGKKKRKLEKTKAELNKLKK